MDQANDPAAIASLEQFGIHEHYAAFPSVLRAALRLFLSVTAQHQRLDR